MTATATRIARAASAVAGPGAARQLGDQPAEQQLKLDRCPHCNVADPQLPLLQEFKTEGARTRQKSLWGIFHCVSCGGIISVRTPNEGRMNDGRIEAIFPRAKAVAIDLPPSARQYLKQAMDSMASPDAAVLMAGSAVDAMLKAKGYKKGSLFTRIKMARDEGLLTPDMAEWAHEVRLVSNDTRHADEENPHATPEQARQMIEFAEALGEFLFVLPARISRARDGGGKA
jgi:hypothetical protein